MNSKKSHSINVLETPFSTVTSSGHWFHATRRTINEYVPGLMKIYPFEDLISKAVTWIDSADSLAMILFFALVFFINPWVAAVLSLLFHYWWYHQKSAFVNIPTTTVLKLINQDFFQLLLAAVVLSFMGIWGMYTAVVLGIITFFLFKIGLLRRLWDKFDAKRESTEQLPLNDRTLKMVLVRYSLYQNMPPKEIEKLDRHVQQAVIDYHKKKKK
jgi:hypothetical protein